MVESTEKTIPDAEGKGAEETKVEEKKYDEPKDINPKYPRGDVGGERPPPEYNLEIMTDKNGKAIYLRMNAEEVKKAWEDYKVMKPEQRDKIGPPRDEFGRVSTLEFS